MNTDRGRRLTLTGICSKHTMSQGEQTHRVLIVVFTILSYAAYSSGVDWQHEVFLCVVLVLSQNSPLVLCLQGVKQQLS